MDEGDLLSGKFYADANSIIKGFRMLYLKHAIDDVAKVVVELVLQRGGIVFAKLARLQQYEPYDALATGNKVYAFRIGYPRALHLLLIPAVFPHAMLDFVTIGNQLIHGWLGIQRALDGKLDGFIVVFIKVGLV